MGTVVCKLIEATSDGAFRCVFVAGAEGWAEVGRKGRDAVDVSLDQQPRDVYQLKLIGCEIGSTHRGPGERRGCECHG